MLSLGRLRGTCRGQVRRWRRGPPAQRVGSTSGQCRLSQILKFYVAAREKKFTWFSVIFYKLVYADVFQNAFLPLLFSLILHMPWVFQMRVFVDRIVVELEQVSLGSSVRFVSELEMDKVERAHRGTFVRLVSALEVGEVERASCPELLP